MDNEEIWKKVLNQTKYCRICHVHLTVDNIYKNTLKCSNYICKHCFNDKGKKYYETHKEHYVELHKKYYSTHKEIILVQQREYKKKYKKSHENKIREYSKKYYQQHVEKYRAYTQQRKHAKQQLFDMTDQEFIEYIRMNGYFQ
jgi:hypothetical protein